MKLQVEYMLWKFLLRCKFIVIITINFIHVATEVEESIRAFIIKFLNIKWMYKVFKKLALEVDNHKIV